MKRSVHLEGSQEGQPEGVQAHTDGGEAQDKQMLISRAAGPAQFLHGSVPTPGQQLEKDKPTSRGGFSSLSFPLQRWVLGVRVGMAELV